MCVLILLYMCPHTAIYLSSYCYKCVLILLYMRVRRSGEGPESWHQISLHAEKALAGCLLHMPPHTTKKKFKKKNTAPQGGGLLYMRPHTTICVLILLYIYVLMLLYMCPHTNIYRWASYPCTCMQRSATSLSPCLMRPLLPAGLYLSVYPVA